jgi:hypothetical protein
MLLISSIAQSARTLQSTELLAFDFRSVHVRFTVELPKSKAA